MALSLNRTQGTKWVDLGIHTEACMTRPETCGAAGGAVSVWVKVTECPGEIEGGIGIITSQSSDQKTGFSIMCLSSEIGCVNIIHYYII